MLKRLFFTAFGLVSLFSYANNNLTLRKEELKATLVSTSLEVQYLNSDGVIIADRLEADAFLELAGKEYEIYAETYKKANKVRLIKGQEAIVIMPRIDLLKANLENLSKSAEDVYVFIMEGDKLENNEIYGDRSYETYLKSGIAEMLPSNVKVLKLYDQSVNYFKGKNNFDIFIPITETVVYREQIYPIYQQLSKKNYIF